MESVLQPPRPFIFENNLVNVTSGNLCTEWERWKKAFYIYYEACELSQKDPKVQINILLHIIGDKCREVYEQFTGEIKSIKELLLKFDKFFIPKKNLAVERQKFFKRDQKELESIEQYAFELNKIASKCEFQNLRDDLVCSRLICGIQDVALSERLLREPEITLIKAVEICKLAEMSRMQAMSIKSENHHHVHEIAQSENKQQDHLNIHAINRRRPMSSRGRPPRVDPPPPAQVTRYRTSYGARESSPPTTFRSQVINNSRSRNINKNCGYCGRIHRRNECPAYGQRCNKCQRQNHFARMCRVYTIQEDSSDQASRKCFVIDSHKCSDWVVKLDIHGQKIIFKLDTGADVNVLPKRYLSLINVSENDLTTSSTRLQGYSGMNIAVLGKCYLKIAYKNNHYFLKFIVADVDSPPVLSRSSCEELKLIKRILSLKHDSNSEEILNEYPDIFVGMGCLQGEHKIQIRNDILPVVHAPRKLPLAIREQVKNKLKEMENENIIAKVEGPTDWVNSLTVVKKPNGDLRLCLDPRDLNRAIKREHFKLPTFEEITANLIGAKYFSTLDAKQGFWQVKLHPESTDLCTFNTVFGRYKFLRMPYGISSASEIFHKKLYENFDDIEGVVLFIDDLLIHGPTKEIHDQRLHKVLKRCQEINIKLNKQKCKIGLTEIKYLGHKFTKDGIYPDDSHVIAVKNMPRPNNIKDLERFLGLITYVSNFVPNVSEKTSILRELLKKDIAWHWDNRHDKCFEKLKECLSSRPVLQYYDMEKPIVLSVDASKTGLGACLMQNNLPVCYASKSLTKTEQAYAQIEKELYACVFACEKFYMYIYGRSDVIIETDHKPLVSIINKPLVSAPARLQRMLMRLQPYCFTLVYKPGKYLYIADTLSRAVAPGLNTPSEPRDHLDVQAQVCALSANNPLTDTHFLKIQRCTQEDEEMQELIKLIKRGWPNEKKYVKDNLKCFWDCRDEMTVHFGIIWRGTRVIVPKCMRHEMLQNIHIGHMGLQKCKLRAREIMFWPNMNTQLEDYLSHCQACLTYRKQNNREPLIPHEIPSRPWYKIGIDLFHLNKKSFLIVVDYYSKFIEVEKLNSLTSEYIINKLKIILRRQGIPEVIMSDNGPEFSSNKFKEFSKNWNFQHVTSSPRYPQSNGQVERTVQTIKNMMKKTEYDQTDFNLALLEYLNTPLDKDLESPAELLYCRKLRSILPCIPTKLLPKTRNINRTSRKLKDRQIKQKYYYDRGTRELQELKKGQKVKVRFNNQWINGTIHDIKGIRSYMVQTYTGNIIRRNRKHLIVDSNERREVLQYPHYDDVIYNSYDARTQSSSGNPVQSADSSSTQNHNYVTRFGRIVRPPDRWTYSSTTMCAR